MGQNTRWKILYRLCIDVYGVAAFLAVSKGQETGERKDGKRTDGDDLI